MAFQPGSSLNAIISMTSRLPATAPPGMPPAMILAIVVRSGVTPNRCWAPPGAQRKPVMTSSKMSSDAVLAGDIANGLEEVLLRAGSWPTTRRSARE